jgi:hypothetical protein
MVEALVALALVLAMAVALVRRKTLAWFDILLLSLACRRCKT